MAVCVCVCVGAIVVGFNMTSYSVAEGSPVQVCVGVATGTLQRNITLNIYAINGTAYGEQRSAE